MPIKLTFRPVQPSDEAFLYDVFSSSRPDIAASNLGNAQKRELMRLQFRAQHTEYRSRRPDADFLIVLLGNVAVGRLYLDRRPDVLHIMDIALLPEYRGQGIGRRLMSDILAEAQRTGRAVRIYLEHFNPALAWYERMGFEKIQTLEAHYLMEWRPRGVVIASA